MKPSKAAYRTAQQIELMMHLDGYTTLKAARIVQRAMNRSKRK